MSHLAAKLIADPPQKLPWPKQGSYGNCWLLTALVGLQRHYPRLVLDMVSLYPHFAVVQLPYRNALQIDYRVPSGLVRIREAADLYCALICKAVCVIMQRRRGEDLYAACHGGQVSNALQMLCPSHPPMIFCETLRDNTWHSLLLLQGAGSRLLCYDPHQGAIAIAAESCRLIAYSSCSFDAP